MSTQKNLGKIPYQKNQREITEQKKKYKQWTKNLKNLLDGFNSKLDMT